MDDADRLMERYVIENPIPYGYDYSHLVGSSVQQHSKAPHAVEFEELLTDYDRILLEFGMRILISSESSRSQMANRNPRPER